MSYGFLIGGINGLLFSYYAEAPAIFMNHFGLTSMQYGLIGIVVAFATILGAMFSKSLLNRQKAEQIILIGLAILIIGTIFLLIMSMITFSIKKVQLIGLLLGIFIILLGSGIALPNCLSLALVDFKEVIGSAGALFSLGYYLLVSIVTYGMSVLHNGSLLVMPLYFLVLGILMIFLAKRFILSEN